MKIGNAIKRSVSVVIAMTWLAGCGSADDPKFQGYVEGEPVRIAAGISGRLDVLSVVQGQRVQAGAALFVLDATAELAALKESQARQAAAQAQLADLEKGQRPEELAIIRAQLEQARAQTALSAVQLDRQRRLRATNAVSQEQLDQTRAQNRSDVARERELSATLRSAELAGRSDALIAAQEESNAAAAQVTQAQWRLAQKTQSASAAGRIEDVYYRAGEWIAAGAPVLSLLPPANRKLRFFVPEPALGGLRPEQRLRVTCDGCGEPIAAKISFIATQAEYTPPLIYSESRRERLVFMIEARTLPEQGERLHPGQPVEIELLP